MAILQVILEIETPRIADEILCDCVVCVDKTSSVGSIENKAEIDKIMRQFL